MKTLILGTAALIIATMFTLDAIDKALDDTRANIHRHTHTIEE